jgi:polyisoprenoid-binding protein YceI
MRQQPAVLAVTAAALLVLGAGALATQAAAPLSIVADESDVVISVGKAGVLGFAGHAHEVAAPRVRGTVVPDPSDWSRSSVSLDVDAAALRVTGAGEPAADVPEVQRVMLGDRVLDAGRFPTVSFRSSRVAVRSLSGTGADLQVEGEVTLHGIARPLAVPVHVSWDGPGALIARGAFSLKQSAFGIQPVTAAGGTVKVRDEVEIRFVLKARR